jgi:DNA-binding PadR family transcriptional regulator
MNVKSAVLRVLYNSNRHTIDKEDRLHAIMYIISNRTKVQCSFEKRTCSGPEIELHSEEVEEAIEDLRSHRLVETKINQTIGGEKTVTYQLTKKGVDQMERLLTDSNIEEKISKITTDYDDYPLSNLLNEIYESEDSYKWD